MKSYNARITEVRRWND